MAFDEDLAARIRERPARLKGVEERRMFGGVAFLLDGNLLVGVWKDSLIARHGGEQGGLPNERLTIRHDAGSGAEPYVGGALVAVRRVMGLTGLVRAVDVHPGGRVGVEGRRGQSRPSRPGGGPFPEGGAGGPRDGRAARPPVATLDTVRRVWLPACGRLGLELVPRIVAEVERLRAWAAGRSDGEHLADRCSGVLAAFARTDTAACESDFG